MLMTSVSSDISQASMKAVNDERGATSAPKRPVLRKSASMAFQQAPEEIRCVLEAVGFDAKDV